VYYKVQRSGRSNLLPTEVGARNYTNRRSIATETGRPLIADCEESSNTLIYGIAGVHVPVISVDAAFLSKSDSSKAPLLKMTVRVLVVPFPYYLGAAIVAWFAPTEKGMVTTEQMKMRIFLPS
jgi:hypothetical protein